MKTAKGYRKEFGAIRRQYFQNHEEQCEKCCSRTRIDLNHIIALQDGGTNNPENLSPLCRTCHKQWHEDCEQVMSYEEFLEYPTRNEMNWLSVLMQQESTKGMTPDDYETARKVIQSFSRDMEHDLNYERR